jgi:ankyrin repeat protein
MCPKGTEINLRSFLAWLSQHHKEMIKEANALYEEFKGVLTGSIVHKPYLSKEDYCHLGVKQSIFSLEDRSKIYVIFEKYLSFLSKGEYYDINMLSYDYLKLSRPKYDLVVIDEIQDLTNIQLYLILRMLNYPDQFILCGDSNQIVHPNFFSWANIKTLFYHELIGSREITRIIKKNYRNSHKIIELANKILKIKNTRFGSIDRESNFLIEGSLENEGDLECIMTTHEMLHEFNLKTKRSVKYAIIVMHEEMKEEVKRHFQTPLVFSIQEAKGLEYDNVILYQFIACERKRYLDISEGISLTDLQHNELNYARAKNKSDRSLEIYKFYINALYVAVTRAIKNLYIFEPTQIHPLLNLLDLKNSERKFSLESESSSLEEWRREAHKLELQGKKEQADEIRSTILNYKKVPWQIITNQGLLELSHQAFSQDKKSKEARIALFEYALIYQQQDIIEKLRLWQFKPASFPKNALELLDRKYFAFYKSQNMSNIFRQIDSYGIEFRNTFNQTSLMIASKVGNTTLVQKLIENGANVQAMDNLCRNPLQLALNIAYFDKLYAKSKLPVLYPLLAAPSISIKVEEKLIKIDNRLMEFFVLNMIIGTFLHKKRRSGELYAFSTQDFIEPLSHFPEQVLPERRKKRSYISSIFSKNEVSSLNPYNRQLFLRVARGYYILNTNLEIRTEEGWVKLKSDLVFAMSSNDETIRSL